MVVLDWIRSLLGSGRSKPAQKPSSGLLHGDPTNEDALGASLDGLPLGVRAYITEAEYARLFLGRQGGDPNGFDEASRARFGVFAAAHKCSYLRVLHRTTESISRRRRTRMLSTGRSLPMTSDQICLG